MPKTELVAPFAFLFCIVALGYSWSVVAGDAAYVATRLLTEEEPPAPGPATLSAPIEREFVEPAVIAESVPPATAPDVALPDPTEERNRHNSMARRGLNRLGSQASLAEKRLLWEILEEHESVEALVITPKAFELMDQINDGFTALGHLREAEAGLPDASAEKARQLAASAATELRELVTQLRGEFNL